MATPYRGIFLTVMNNNILDKIFAITCPILIASCSLSTHQASSRLSNLSREEFFTGSQVILAESIENENITAIRNVIQSGANPNAISREGMTPLMWSIIKSKKKSYLELLRRGGDPNLMTYPKGPGAKGISPMITASIMNDDYYLQTALQHGGDPNASSSVPSWSILFDAIKNHRSKNVNLLLSHGANVNHRDRNGDTPLNTSLYSSQYDIAYILLQKGANKNIKNRFGVKASNVYKSDQRVPLDQLGWYHKLKPLLSN